VTEKALLKDLGRVGVEASGCAATDVEVVHQNSRDRDAFTIDTHRHERHDVRQMLSAGIGVVGDDDVAFEPVLYLDVMFEDVAKTARHGIEVHGHPRRLRRTFAIGIEHGRGVVEVFANDR